MITGETVLSGASSHEQDPLVSEFKVMHSNAGWYVGTTYLEEIGEEYQAQVPNTRETGYFATQADAEAALYTYIKYGTLPNQR